MAERTAPECGCITTGKIVRGMCAMHYDRWVHSTPKDQRGTAPRFSRDFWDYVDKSGDCWVWTGSTNAKGYGWWSGGGRRGLAHRIALAEVSPEPDGMMACHHCDNPPCVRPAHLYWGTARTNAADVVARQGMHNKGKFVTHCPEGHELVGDNLRVVGRNDKRVCRTCDNARALARYHRRKVAPGV